MVAELRSIVDEFVCVEGCDRCWGTGTVCEDHPDRPGMGDALVWGGCDCGAAGMPCGGPRWCQWMKGPFRWGSEPGLYQYPERLPVTVETPTVFYVLTGTGGHGQLALALLDTWARAEDIPRWRGPARQGPGSWFGDVVLGEGVVQIVRQIPGADRLPEVDYHYHRWEEMESEHVTYTGPQMEMATYVVSMMPPAWFTSLAGKQPPRMTVDLPAGERLSLLRSA